MQALTRLAAAGCCLLAFALPSQAAFRAYLSINGTDNPTCGLGNPCRLMTAAMTAVNDGGEIWLLDSGNYNLVTIDVTKSVSIEAAPGVIGSILAINGPAFSMTTPGVNLVLRNLVIKQLAGNGSTHGVYANAGASLTVERCTIADMPGNGLSIHAALAVRVSDTVLRGNVTGVNLDSGPSASFVRTTFAGNAYGLNAGSFGGLIPVDIRDSVFTGNTAAGINVTGAGTGTVTIGMVASQLGRNANGIALDSVSTGKVFFTATGNLIANNTGDGLRVTGANATAVISDNTVTGNLGNGINNISGNVLSPGTNVVRLNGTDSAGVIFGIGRL